MAVKLFAANRNGAEAVNVLFRDLTIRADRINGLGTSVRTVYDKVVYADPTAIEKGVLVVGGPPRPPAPPKLAPGTLPADVFAPVAGAKAAAPPAAAAAAPAAAPAVVAAALPRPRLPSLAPADDGRRRSRSRVVAGPACNRAATPPSIVGPGAMPPSWPSPPGPPLVSNRPLAKAQSHDPPR